MLKKHRTRRISLLRRRELSLCRGCDRRAVTVYHPHFTEARHDSRRVEPRTAYALGLLAGRPDRLWRNRRHVRAFGNGHDLIQHRQQATHDDAATGTHAAASPTLSTPRSSSSVVSQSGSISGTELSSRSV